MFFRSSSELLGRSRSNSKCFLSSSPILSAKLTGALVTPAQPFRFNELKGVVISVNVNIKIQYTFPYIFIVSKGK